MATNIAMIIPAAFCWFLIVSVGTVGANRSKRGGFIVFDFPESNAVPEETFVDRETSKQNLSRGIITNFMKAATSAAFSNDALAEAIKTYVPTDSLVSEDPNKIRFFLYNDKTKPEAAQELVFKNLDSVKKSLFKAGKNSKFLLHGFMQDYNGFYPQNVKNAYLKKGMDVNVVAVDWGALAIQDAPYIAPAFYSLAVKNVATVGQRLGDFLVWLNDNSLITNDKIHILGFSLGSHAAGKAGSVFKDTTKKDVARVTALDPAGPSFWNGKARSLTASDGKFVDAYHTNAGQLGSWTQVGHVDFFINGGAGPQPGCVNLVDFAGLVGTAFGSLTGICSHSASTYFYAQSILNGESKPGDFKSCSCNNMAFFKLGTCGCVGYVAFGEYGDATAKGVQFVPYKPNIASK